MEKKNILIVIMGILLILSVASFVVLGSNLPSAENYMFSGHEEADYEERIEELEDRIEELECEDKICIREPKECIEGAERSTGLVWFKCIEGKWEEELRCVGNQELRYTADTGEYYCKNIGW